MVMVMVSVIRLGLGFSLGLGLGIFEKVRVIVKFGVIKLRLVVGLG